MADKSQSKYQSDLKHLLSRRELAMLAGKARIEAFNGDNSSDQTFRLQVPASQIFKVVRRYEGSAELSVKEGRHYKLVSSLTGEAYGFLFTEGTLLTFGDGTDGGKPPDTSAKDVYAFYVISVAADVYDGKTTTITWTGDTIADDIVPDSDTAIYVKGNDECSLVLDTTDFSTGAPTVNIKVIASKDGTIYHSAGEYLVQPLSGIAEAKTVPAAVNVKAWTWIKLRADVVTANIDGTEFFTVKVTPQWRLKE